MMKRLTAIFLCLLMFFALLPVAVAEDEAEEPAVSEVPDEGDQIVTDEITAPAEEPEADADAVADAPEEDTDAAVAEPEADPDAILEEPEEDPDASTVILINEENFPDENFRKWIVANVPGVTVDANGVCSITSDDAKKVTSIIVNGQSISSLSGIRKFSKLDTLDCRNNKIKYLDVSSLKELTYLNCSDNKLEKLVLGSTKKLASLYCLNNKLPTISLKYNVGMKAIYCANNVITSLDTSKLTELTHLDCSYNSLTKLDVSKNTKLAKLDCNHNKLTALNVTANIGLEELTVSYNELKTIDLTKNGNLRFFEGRVCSFGKFDVTKNAELQYLDVGVNNLTALDVTKNSKLYSLDCETNQLKLIDVTKNGNLTYLHVDGNPMTSIDITKNTGLIEFTAFSCALTAINVTYNTQLRRLSVGGNFIGSITLSGNSLLEDLDVSYNELYTLNLSSNTKLKKLWCNGNHLKMLDLSMLTNLTEIEFSELELLAPTGIVYSGGDYKFDMNTMFSSFEKVEPAVYPLNKITGFVTLPGYVDSFDYLYDTGKGKMPVKLHMPYSGPATVVFMKPTVDFRGTTPFVVYDGKEKKPTVTVKDGDGNIINPNRYTVAYSNNVNPGTATVTVTFINTLNTATGWFKIYLPGPKTTTVENTATGITIKWSKVDKAIGYVIYRRAWNLSSSSWTDFARWNNTTALEWTDTSVYAGTRYQYGIKAYFTNAFDTNNLGVVGPLKTTVRITTRVLNEVTPYSGKLVVKWDGSKYCTGYEVQYARDAAFTSYLKTVKIKKNSTYSTTITNLKSKTTYYVRVRSYTEMEGMTYYGEWSNVKNATTK